MEKSQRLTTRAGLPNALVRGSPAARKYQRLANSVHQHHIESMKNHLDMMRDMNETIPKVYNMMKALALGKTVCTTNPETGEKEPLPVNYKTLKSFFDHWYSNTKNADEIIHMLEEMADSLDAISDDSDVVTTPAHLGAVFFSKEAIEEATIITD